MTNTNNELTDFQKKVFAEYELIKGLGKSSTLINEGREKNKKGCLSAPFIMIADLIIGKAVSKERRKRNHAGSEREARELLRQKEISDKICEGITENNKEILTEEKFVNKLTAALYQSDLAIRFVIPENVVLYAMMATEVFNIGLDNFCNDKKGNE